MTTSQQQRLDLAMTMTLTRGSHAWDSRTDNPLSCGACARELAHWIVTGDLSDCNVAGYTACWAALPPLNDGRWRDDAHRTQVIIPYLSRLILVTDEHDQQRAYALADYAVRTCAAEAMDSACLTDQAAALRALAPIVDKTTAAHAADVAADVAAAAANAASAAIADAAAANACDAADTACSACSAAYSACGAAGGDGGGDSSASAGRAADNAAAAANDASAVMERHTRAILDIICAPL